LNIIFRKTAALDASVPTPIFASHPEGTFAKVGVKGPLANLLMRVEFGFDVHITMLRQAE
jgi:hypothetical protein